MKMNNVEDIYPLSPAQQGMLFHSLYAPESGVYLEQMSFRMSGALDLDAFERAWQQIVDRHAVLRTGIVWEELDEPLQVVERRVELPVSREDWRHLAEAERDARLLELLA